MRALTLLLVLAAGCIDGGYGPRFFGARGELPPSTGQDPLFKTLPAVIAGSVQIIAVDIKGEGLSRGSGVVVGFRRILTARHMTEDGASTWVVKQGSKNVKARCIARGVGPLDDWALLESEGGLGEAVPVMALGVQPDLYAQAVAVGYGLGYPDPTVTVGHLQVIGDSYIRFSAPITFGNSGGGLYVLHDGELRLVALTVAVGVSSSGAVWHMGIGVPVSLIRKQGGLR